MIMTPDLRTTCRSPARRSARHGAVLVEFAFVCPLLIMTAIACADLGRVSHYYETVANAARVGAETGACQQFSEINRPAWEARIRQSVEGELQTLPGFDANEMTYGLVVTDKPDGSHEIEVNVGYRFRMWLRWPGLPANVDLEKQVTYRQFR
jgi:hypothetical protein